MPGQSIKDQFFTMYGELLTEFERTGAQILYRLFSDTINSDNLNPALPQYVIEAVLSLTKENEHVAQLWRYRLSEIRGEGYQGMITFNDALAVFGYNQSKLKVEGLETEETKELLDEERNQIINTLLEATKTLVQIMPGNEGRDIPRRMEQILIRLLRITDIPIPETLIKVMNFYNKVLIPGLNYFGQFDPNTSIKNLILQMDKQKLVEFFSFLEVFTEDLGDAISPRLYPMGDESVIVTSIINHDLNKIYYFTANIRMYLEWYKDEDVPNENTISDPPFNALMGDYIQNTVGLARYYILVLGYALGLEFSLKEITETLQVRERVKVLSDVESLIVDSLSSFVTLRTLILNASIYENVEVGAVNLGDVLAKAKSVKDGSVQMMFDKKMLSRLSKLGPNIPVFTISNDVSLEGINKLKAQISAYTVRSTSVHNKKTLAPQDGHGLELGSTIFPIVVETDPSGRVIVYLIPYTIYQLDAMNREGQDS